MPAPVFVRRTTEGRVTTPLVRLGRETCATTPPERCPNGGTCERAPLGVRPALGLDLADFIDRRGRGDRCGRGLDDT